MEYHIKRSLEINPNYTAALIMRSAVAVARFDLDHQLDKLFHEFEYVMDRIPYNTNFRDFVDQNMKYLDGSNSDKYVSFCHRVGYEFFYQKKKIRVRPFIFYNMDWTGKRKTCASWKTWQKFIRPRGYQEGG